MGYTENQFESAVEEFGEVMFVLESDREYIIHGKSGYEINGSVVRASGIQGGEFVIVEFPLDVIEHHYTHKEL